LPIPGSRLLGAARAAKPLLNQRQVNKARKVTDEWFGNLARKERSSEAFGKLPKDQVGRAPLPVSKAPVQTARGPRGPINIEQPRQLPLRLGGGRNTGGVSETDKAMIDWMLPKTTGKYRVKEIDKVKWNKDQLPRKSDRILQRRPANAEEVGIIEDLTKKGFYNKSGSKGIMNSPPAKSQMEKVGAAKRTEQLTNRRKFLEDAIRLNRSKIAANEAPSKDYNRLLEEYSRLIESLK